MRRFITPVLIIFVLLFTSCEGLRTMTGAGGGAYQGLTGGNSYNSCPVHFATSAAPRESGPITLTVAGWASSPAEDGLVLQNLNNFMRLHPNITVKWSPNYDGDYPTQLRSYATKPGSTPDVFYMRPDISPEYIAGGKLLNLSPYMARDNVPASNYYSALLNPFTCKDGQIYGLPKDWNSLGIFYNKSLFDAAHVPYPTANWTWNEMRQAALQLTRHTGNARTKVYGITLTSDASRWLAFLFANGGTVLNAGGKEAVFNSQAGVDALNFYASFQKQDGSSALPTAIVPAGHNDTFDAFGTQRAAMVVEGGWLIPYLAQNYANVHYGIAPVPVAPSGQRGDLIFTNAWSAFAYSKHPEAAWELIKYMTGQTVQKSQLDAGFALPSLVSLANDPYFTQHPDVKVLFDAAQYGYADVYGPNDKFIHDRIALAISSVLFGEASVKEALDNAANQINRLLQT